MRRRNEGARGGRSTGQGEDFDDRDSFYICARGNRSIEQPARTLVDAFVPLRETRADRRGPIDSEDLIDDG